MMEFSGPHGNGSLNDRPFSEKIKTYEKSSYSLTRNLSKYSQWDKEAIDARTENIASLVWKIWGPDQETKHFDL